MTDDDLSRVFIRFRDHGDVDALALAFDRTAPDLLRVAKHLLGDAAGAEDLVQQTFLTAMKRARSFRDGSPLRPWLCGILVQHARNEWRRRRRVREHAASLARESNAPSAVETAIASEDRREFAAAIAALASPYREVVAANLFDGAAPRDIAIRLARTPSRVRVQLHRGLRALRGLLPRGLPAVVAIRPAPRGIDAIRSEVLHEAAACVAARDGLIFVGGLAMGKKLAVLAAAIVVAFVAMLALDPFHAAAPPADPAASAPPPVIAAPVASAPVAAAPAVRQGAPPSAEVPLEPLPRVRAGDTRIAGRIISASDGSPVPGAHVAVEDRVGEPVIRGSTVSGDDGRFAIEGLALDRSDDDLRVDAPGHATLQLGLLSRLEAAGMRDGALDVGDVEVERGESIAGVVLDAAGAPAKAALVFVGAEPLDSFAFVGAEARLGARADDVGRFRIDHVPPTDGGGRVQLLAVTDQGIGAAETLLRRGIGLLADVEIPILPAAVVAVHVAGPDGDAVSNARVTAEPRFVPMLLDRVRFGQPGIPQSPQPAHGLYLGAPALADCFRAVTDGDGAARLARLPATATRGGPARYDVVVEADGFATRYVDDVAFDADGADLRVDLEPLRLRRIEGIVLDPDGRPHAGAEVRLGAQSPRRPSRSYPPEISAADGTFAFKGLRPELAWSVVAFADGLRPRAGEVSFGEAGDPDAARVELRFERSLAVRGKLVDQDAAPVAFAMLSVGTRNTDGSFFGTRTGAHGEFATWSRDRDVVIEGVGFDSPANRWKDPHPRWQVRAGEGDLVLRVERASIGSCRLAIRVTRDAKPVEIDHAWLEAVDVEHGVARRVGRVSIGAVDCPDVEPGTWRLALQLRGYGRFDREVVVPAGVERMPIDVELPPPGTVRLRVAFPAGRARECSVTTDRDVSAGHVLRVAALEPCEFAAAPGPLRLRIDTPFLVGEASTVVVDGIVETTIEARVGGQLETDGLVGLPAGRAALFVAPAGEDLRLARALDTCVAGCGSGEASATVPAGKGRWRVAFRADAEGGAEPADADAWPVLAEGEYRVGAEERMKLSVPRSD